MTTFLTSSSLSEDSSELDVSLGLRTFAFCGGSSSLDSSLLSESGFTGVGFAFNGVFCFAAGSSSDS